ncbi:MAG: outer membrane protein assembly factor BamE [Burkholderiaceae bacterium]|nr:MAG: outer membrane protein assembly factor BamE [Burkholderiaceae bacterium]
MRSMYLRGARLSLGLIAGTGLVACSAFNSASNGVVGLITPYKVEIVQGNFVSKEQVQALTPGMSRQQVRDILGTPLMTDMFHADRWDYVFTLKRQGVAPQERKLTVFFKNGVLERFEGDEMPSEAEFVASLSSGRKVGKVPVLEASPESLKKFPPAPAPASASSQPSAPLPESYPPLEAAAH